LLAQAKLASRKVVDEFRLSQALHLVDLFEIGSEVSADLETVHLHVVAYSCQNRDSIVHVITTRGFVHRLLLLLILVDIA
jgi:hypothetical protein